LRGDYRAARDILDLESVITGRERKLAGPESITRAVVVESGLAASRRPGMTGREFPFNPQR
jgi:hypothetical protein